ncbi:MAG: AAA family ATPase [Rikenellaceae bacterium]
MQPATIFERRYENGVSTIKFGTKLKLSNAAKEEITLKCLPNMSVLAAYMQVNVSIPEVEDVLAYFNKRGAFTISPSNSQVITKYEALKDVKRKDYILKYLKEADFNITDIYTQELAETSFGEITCKHTVINKDGEKETFELDEEFESAGTQITMEIASRINILIENDGLLLVDEIESSLHPKLVEYIIERFLQESRYAQLLATTHYDGLLAQDDLLRKDNIWFTEKGADGASTLYPLTDFKALNRISSLQKAYKFGKFGAILNI